MCMYVCTNQRRDNMMSMLLCLFDSRVRKSKSFPGIVSRPLSCSDRICIVLLCDALGCSATQFCRNLILRFYYVLHCFNNPDLLYAFPTALFLAKCNSWNVIILPPSKLLFVFSLFLSTPHSQFRYTYTISRSLLMKNSSHSVVVGCCVDGSEDLRERNSLL